MNLLAPIRVLHLSDFHFSSEQTWDADAVLGRLLEDVKSLVRDGLSPDVIAITGDIANRGAQEEYTLAKMWILRLLEVTGCAPARVLMVPGNHDVDRKQVGFVAQSIQEALLRSRQQDDIARILGNESELRPILERHRNWLEFLATFAPAVKTTNVPWFTESLNIRGVKLQVSGFCSSWMSWSDNDHGRLLIGRWQAHHLINGRKGSDVAIALMHHPWSYLAEWDAHEVQEEIVRHHHLVLRGHLHRQHGHRVADPDRSTIELAAGSCYSGSAWSNAYQLIEISVSTRFVKVHLRLWDGHDWIPDRNAYRNAAAGVATFPLKRADAEEKIALSMDVSLHSLHTNADTEGRQLGYTQPITEDPRPNDKQESTYTSLGQGDWLEPTVEPPAGEQDRPWLSIEAENAHTADQDWRQRVTQVLSGIDERDSNKALAIWRRHLRRNLLFPFSARLFRQVGSVLAEDSVVVRRVTEVSSVDGVMVEITYKDQHPALPLYVLTVVDRSSQNHQLVSDYGAWFAAAFPLRGSQ